MKKNYFIKITAFAVVFFSLSVTAQSTKNYWSEVSDSDAKKSEQILRKISLKKEKFYQLNIDGLKNSLNNIGTRENIGNTIISFPNSQGEINRYKVFEASVMDAQLQAEFPNIRSYAGQGIDNPAEIVRFTITPKGLNAMFLGTKNGTQFIDPYTIDGKTYTVYSKRSLNTPDFEFECAVIDDEEILNKTFEESSIAKNADDGILRNYRLAIAATGEYTAFHGGTVSGAMAAIATTITRVNGIYERDLSITMTLVANNSSIVYTNASTDPFDNDNAGLLINQSQTVIDGAIGSANYDVGHTFSTGGGGLAALGSSCVNGNKARGITGSPAPVGDAYDVDYVAHELGHQFGSTHTFNGNQGSCVGTNRTANSAYEPGSGSTIMAYAGICGSNNVQNNSDDYFHQKSLDLIWNHITSSGACPTNTTFTGNNEPIANAGANYTIPQGTPYKLDASSSSDPDGLGTLTYTWEQYDLGTAGMPLETSVTGPIVRSFTGTNNPIRYIPRLSDIVANGGVSTAWEKLSTVNRNLNFSLTVRDNDASGGQTDVDFMTATVTTAAGPFVVTSQNVDGQSWDIGSTQTITWDVAGTTANGVNESSVNILLSTDGENFDTVLASNVPNDGSHDIVVPNVASSSCRIMVEAANGIFFNLNTEDISIGVTVTCTEYSTGPISTFIPDGTGANTAGTPVFVPITINDNEIIAGNITVSVDVTHSYIGDLVMQLQSPSGSFANIWARNCNDAQYGNIDVTFEDGATTISCNSPTTGTFNPANPLSIFDGEDINGTWNLAFVDFWTGDTGTVNSWSLEICTDQLSVDENQLENLAIYPNPNNGEFNIGFSPKSGEDIEIQVYDIRGRAIFSKNYNTTSRFEEAISLNNAQSGVYLLTIADGSNKITRKIIVE
ncbi:reprolysin-like metallopeptidase [Winogradskyella sp. SYSU M77433]|uniref:zinc-dependent metalloprotease n=1 Tax=Winogradskyella sp. SYSU M77433 TaxID=3042722 RepID=UPI0024814C03|nr:zinc-dependent metalloprotease family protein [Winogradskyella sp. SYSU M77433]MDH7913800.1 M12 family metallo-peptidase [Winogradskyella sp. SYSU M77433]